MFVCDKDNLDKAYRGDLFMEKVIKTAKEIAGKEKIPLYLCESEIRRLDREEAVEEGENRARTEMIINFYNNGASLDLISKSSGLSIEEIKNIIKSNQEHSN